jgi:hypothetical protein
MSGGDRFSTDRFALTKIAEDVFLACEIGGANAIALTKMIRECDKGMTSRRTSPSGKHKSLEAARESIRIAMAAVLH